MTRFTEYINNLFVLSTLSKIRIKNCEEYILLKENKSLRNSKRRSKENFTLKSNLNKIKLCEGGGKISAL